MAGTVDKATFNNDMEAVTPWNEVPESLRNRPICSMEVLLLGYVHHLKANIGNAPLVDQWTNVPENSATNAVWLAAGNTGFSKQKDKTNETPWSVYENMMKDKDMKKDFTFFSYAWDVCTGKIGENNFICPEIDKHMEEHNKIIQLMNSDSDSDAKPSARTNISKKDERPNDGESDDGSDDGDSHESSSETPKRTTRSSTTGTPKNESLDDDKESRVLASSEKAEKKRKDLQVAKSLEEQTIELLQSNFVNDEEKKSLLQFAQTGQASLSIKPGQLNEVIKKLGGFRSSRRFIEGYKFDLKSWVAAKSTTVHDLAAEVNDIADRLDRKKQAQDSKKKRKKDSPASKSSKRSKRAVSDSPTVRTSPRRKQSSNLTSGEEDDEEGQDAQNKKLRRSEEEDEEDKEDNVDEGTKESTKKKKKKRKNKKD